jgi:hypothetical protein
MRRVSFPEIRIREVCSITYNSTLSAITLTPPAAKLSVRPLVLTVRVGGNRPFRIAQRRVARHRAHRALSSTQPGRLRPRSVRRIVRHLTKGPGGRAR